MNRTNIWDFILIESRINSLESNIQKNIHNINSWVIPLDKMDIFKWGVLRKIIKYLTLQYNSWELLPTIQTDFKSNITYVYDYWNISTIPYSEWKYYGSNYHQFLWFVSLAICLDLDKSYFEKLKECNDRFENKDALLNCLIEYGRTWKIVTDGTREAYDPYPKLYELFDVERKSEKEKILVKYTKLWLRWHKWYAFYWTHKWEWWYFGYWSFESAALAKVFGVDTTELSTIEYYPKDLYSWEEKNVVQSEKDVVESTEDIVEKDIVKSSQNTWILWKLKEKLLWGVKNVSIDSELEAVHYIIESVGWNDVERMKEHIDIFMKDVWDFQKLYPQDGYWIESNELYDETKHCCSEYWKALQLVLGDNIATISYHEMDMMEIFPLLNKSINGALKSKKAYDGIVEYYDDNEICIQDWIFDKDYPRFKDWLERLWYDCYAFWQDTDQIFLFLLEIKFRKNMDKALKLIPQLFRFT